MGWSSAVKTEAKLAIGPISAELGEEAVLSSAYHGPLAWPKGTVDAGAGLGVAADSVSDKEPVRTRQYKLCQRANLHWSRCYR